MSMGSSPVRSALWALSACFYASVFEGSDSSISFLAVAPPAAFGLALERDDGVGP
jgi:hypothetical protein